MMTGTISKISGNAISIGKDTLFINGVDITGFKEFDDVTYTKVGFNLETIARASPQQAQTKQSDDLTYLKEVHADDAIPHVILTKSKQDFKKILKAEAIPGAKEIPIGHIIRYKTDHAASGSPILSIWETDANGVSVKKRTSPGRQYDPAAAAKRQEIEENKQVTIPRENALNRSVDIWMNAFPGKWPTSKDAKEITDLAEVFEEWINRGVKNK